MGFNLLEKKYLKNIDSYAFLYEHEKTKAQLLYFQNQDVNKSFSISFKTIPYSNNGIFHILEHSVLGGSEKYPVKEPFVELIKGSFNTFINAMTFPDKTMYPVSSKNEKDLEILTDIYLDAVFNPQILKNDFILQQEGWHYHLEDINDELIYKGVVYNEMKGVYSSVDEILDMHIAESLFKDTSYKYSAGGKPEEITSITQDEFINTYKYCYHPSNSFITLYGDLNLETYLNKLDTYLNAYDYKDYTDYKVVEQKDFSNKTVKATYFNENTENKNYVAINYIIGKNKDFEDIYSVDIIDELILGNSNTPFRKFFIDNGYAEDVYSYIQRDRLQVVYSIVFKNVKDEHVDNIEDLYNDILAKEIEKSFDYEQIEAVINKNIFIIKEEVNKVSSPKGVHYAMRALRNWLYNENPFEIFDYDKIIQILKNNYENKIYEEIAQKLLFDNNSKTTIKLTATNENEQSDSLESYKESLTNEDLENIINDTNKLIEWQESEDSIEDLEKIPSIDSKQVTIKKPYKDTLFESFNDIQFAHYVEQTNGIVYSKFLFDISRFNKEELQYSALLTFLLFNLNTKNKDELEVAKEIDFNLGAINSSVNLFRNDVTNDVNVKFIVAAKNLTDKTDKLVDILTENTLNFDFSNKQAIFSIILELKLSLESRFKNAGHSFINKRLESYHSYPAKLAEYISGYDFYLFVSDLVENFENNFDEISSNLVTITNDIFVKDNIIVSCTATKEEYNEFKQHIINYVNLLISNNIELDICKIPFEPKPLNYAEGFYFDSLVQYVGLGFNMQNYNGALLVLRHILNYDYLWNNVRVKGGAYGVGLTINKYGDTGFWSYRDPNLTNSINTYLNVPEFINKLDIDNSTLNKYIIGTLNAFDQLLSPNEKATISLTNHINNNDPTMFDKLVSEIKNTTLADIKGLASLFENKENNSYKCIIGSKDIIEEHKEIFTKIIEIK